VVTGLQEKFSWQAVAVSGLSAAVNFGVAQSIKESAFASTFLDGPKGILTHTAAHFVTGTSTQLVRMAVYGKGKLDFASLAADAFGNALGEAIGDKLRPKVEKPAAAAEPVAKPAAAASTASSFAQDAAQRSMAMGSALDRAREQIASSSPIDPLEQWAIREEQLNRQYGLKSPEELAAGAPPAAGPNSYYCGNLWENGMCTPGDAPPVRIYPNGDSRATWEAKQFAAGFGKALVDSGLAVLDGYRMIAGMARDRKVEAWSKLGKASQAGQISFSFSGIASGLASSIVNMSPAGIVFNMGSGRAREAGEGAAGLLQLAAGTPRAMAALNRVPVLGAEVPRVWSRSAVETGGVGRVGGAGQATRLDAASASAAFQGEHPYYGVDQLANTSYPVGSRLVQLTHMQDGVPVSSYFTTEEALNSAKLPGGTCDSNVLHQGLQTYPGTRPNFRSFAQTYEVNSEIPFGGAATGPTTANPYFNPGQYPALD
jgi:hypothetical protein